MSLSKSLYYPVKVYFRYLEDKSEMVRIRTKMLTAATLSYSGSLITQKLLQKNPKMDQMRALRYVIFSMLLTPISHFWYKHLDTLFPKEKKIDRDDASSTVYTSVIKKLALDELLYDPFCLVLFFTVMGLLEGLSFREIKERIKTNYWSTQKMSWKIWPVAQVINFAVIPGSLRILFMNVVGLCFNILLQLKVSKKD